MKQNTLTEEHKRLEMQHRRGKLGARERIEILFDPYSFDEMDAMVEHRCVNFGMADRKLPGDGVIIGRGTINGRPAMVCSQDFTVVGGSLGEMHAKKINKAQDMAMRLMIPIIFINDSGGARIHEGVDSLAGYGEVFKRNVDASGIIPQISVIMGPCAGGAVYSPAVSDFIFMVRKTSYMYLTGPDVVKSVTHEDVTHEELGGSRVHSEKSGVCDFVYDDDVQCLQQLRRFFDFLPTSNNAAPPIRNTSDPAGRISTSLGTIIPDDSSKPYDMRHIIIKIIDEGDFFEVKEDFAKNIITGFCRFEGRTVGIVANQPLFLAGCLDSKASVKGARFVRFCDIFNIPILTIVDVPGFLPGTSEESDGIIKHGAKLLYAYAESTVPKVTLITRKAYGGAYIVMGSKHLGADINYSWENSEIAVIGAKAAVSLLYKDKNFTPKQEEIKIEEYQKNIAAPSVAASRGFLDGIIWAPGTRKSICRALIALESKMIPNNTRKKHGNMPL